MLRSLDSDILRRICVDIALENYGFIYLNDHETEIKSRYVSEDDRMLNFGSLSTEELREGLRELAGEYPHVTELREGSAFYFDPFAEREGGRVINTLTDVVFDQALVVNTQTIRSEFDLAPSDVDFFVDELIDREYLERVAGEYFTVGDGLADETEGQMTVANKLLRGAKRGRRDGMVSHSDLERVINVAATQDVIDHLVDNDFVVDLDDKYLVMGAIDQFGEHMAEESTDAIVEEFEASGDAMTVAEFEQVIENEIKARSDVLSKVGSSTYSDILDETKQALREELELETRRLNHGEGKIVVRSEAFTDRVQSQATKLADQAKRDNGGALPSKSMYVEETEQHVEELSIGTEPVNEYFRDQVRAEIEDIAERDLGIADEESA